MVYGKKLALSIMGILVFVSAAVASIYYEENIYVAFLCGCAAFIDSFVYMMPTIFGMISIRSSQIDPNMYSYKRKYFVDRREIYKDINNQIRNLGKTPEKMMWIRLHGDSGVGKKTLISKIFDSYKYPINKFYFLFYKDDADILELMANQFPLCKENFSNEIYYKKLSTTKRTFIVINSEYKDINNKIVKFMSDWAIQANSRHQLIFITYDNDISQGKLINQTYIYEYELSPFNHDDAQKYINVLSPHESDNVRGEIIRFSNGLPATIKFICENSNHSKYEYKQWTNFIVGLRDNLRIKYIKLCTLMLINNSISVDQLNQILEKDEYDTLINSKKIYIQKDHCVIPIWMLNYIRISNLYNEHFIDCINQLYENGLINDLERQKGLILIEKNWLDIYNSIKKLETQGDYAAIKEYYDKLSLDFSHIDSDIQSKVLLIFMNSLLKIGAYNSFDYLVNSSRRKHLISPDMTPTDFQYNLLLADYYHLTSQYEISNSIFEMLLMSPVGGSYTDELEFHLAHNLRHQGDLLLAMDRFKVLANKCNDKSVEYKRTITSIVCIEYYKGIYNREEHLQLLTSLISNDDTDYNVIRHQANIYRREYNDYDKAIKLLKDNLDILEHKQLRILQDYYFELAECYRFKCNDNLAYYNEAISFYNKAILFAELNHDVNLQLCSCIGKALLMHKMHRNDKLLNQQLSSLLPQARKTSDVIEKTIVTILYVLNGSQNSNKNILEMNDLHHHLLVIHSKRIDLLHITVM